MSMAPDIVWQNLPAQNAGGSYVVAVTFTSYDPDYSNATSALAGTDPCWRNKEAKQLGPRPCRGL